MPLEQTAGANLKVISLVTLALQNSSLILIMRYSRTLKGPQYLASVAVLFGECLKFFICYFIYAYNEWKDQRIQSYALQEDHELRGFMKCLISVAKDLVSGDAWKLSIPALLYTIQNNLQYVAVTNLDAATFQVTYQFKIITTAAFSVWLLHRRLNRAQILALILLTIGIALVQVPDTSVPDPKVVPDDTDRVQHRWIGLLAVFIACCLSGLAGVYFERILKRPKSEADLSHSNRPRPSPTLRIDRHRTLQGLLNPLRSVSSSSSSSSNSIWTRSAQLSLFGSFLALLGVFLSDGNAVVKHGLMQGFNQLTWLVIGLQALGGLLVAMVVKYADNILKGFATSISIILSCLVSLWLFDFQPTFYFYPGCLLVLYATYLYESPFARQ